MSKILVGIENGKLKTKEGKELIYVDIHTMTQGIVAEGLIGNRVSTERIWGVEDIYSIDGEVEGKVEIGAQVNVYYEGEGQYKNCTLIRFKNTPEFMAKLEQELKKQESAFATEKPKEKAGK